MHTQRARAAPTLGELAQGSAEDIAQRLARSVYASAEGPHVLALPDETPCTPDTPPDALARVLEVAATAYDRILINLGRRVDTVRAMALRRMDQILLVTTPRRHAQADLIGARDRLQAAGADPHGFGVVVNRIGADAFDTFHLLARCERVVAGLPEDRVTAEHLWHFGYRGTSASPGTMRAGLATLTAWVYGTTP